MAGWNDNNLYILPLTVRLKTAHKFTEDMFEKKKTKKEDSEKAGKKGRPATGLTQKHVAFRMDNELIEFYRSHGNAGRWLNELIRGAMSKEGWEEDCGDMAPEPKDEQPWNEKAPTNAVPFFCEEKKEQAAWT